MLTDTIEKVRMYGYSVSYVHGQYRMSGDRVIESLPSTVVQVVTKSGVEGFGEVCPLSGSYLPQHSAGVRVAIPELGGAVLGLPIGNPAAVCQAMDNCLRGQEAAKSALDVACWDAFGKATGRSVADLLGGTLRTTVPLYVALPHGDPQAMQMFAAREREAGLHRFQIKLGGQPEVDAERVRVVCEDAVPEDAFIGDANGGWRRQAAILAVGLLADTPRFRLEQPCPTFEESLAIRRLTRLPMVLDEVITDVASLLRAVSLDALDHLNLKISRVGGLTKAKLMRDLSVELGLMLTVEDTWGGDLVTAAVSQLAAGVPLESLFAVPYLNNWVTEHICGYEPHSSGGIGLVPDGAGLGVAVDQEALGRPLFSTAL